MTRVYLVEKVERKVNKNSSQAKCVIGKEIVDYFTSEKRLFVMAKDANQLN